MSKKLDGRVALVTGGTTGIGLATAKLFHAEGARVIVTGKNPATLEAARVSLGGIAEVVASDSGDTADIEGLFARIAKEHEGLDVLFLNAGVLRAGAIATMGEADFDEVLRVNVKGPWLALKAAIPLLRRGGAVVLNASPVFCADSSLRARRARGSRECDQPRAHRFGHRREAVLARGRGRRAYRVGGQNSTKATGVDRRDRPRGALSRIRRLVVHDRRRSRRRWRNDPRVSRDHSWRRARGRPARRHIRRRRQGAVRAFRSTDSAAFVPRRD